MAHRQCRCWARPVCRRKSVRKVMPARCSSMFRGSLQSYAHSRSVPLCALWVEPTRVDCVLPPAIVTRCSGVLLRVDANSALEFRPRLRAAKSERFSVVAGAQARAAMVAAAAPTRMKFRAPAANADQNALCIGLSSISEALVSLRDERGVQGISPSPSNFAGHQRKSRGQASREAIWDVGAHLVTSRPAFRSTALSLAKTCSMGSGEYFGKNTEAISAACGEIIAQCPTAECAAYLKNAGYAKTQKQDAIGQQRFHPPCRSCHLKRRVLAEGYRCAPLPAIRAAPCSGRS